MKAGDHQGPNADLYQEIDRLRQQRDELVKALRFYADTCSYMWSLSDKRTKDTRKVLLDSGYLARTAIAKYRHGSAGRR